MYIYKLCMSVFNVNIYIYIYIENKTFIAQRVIFRFLRRFERN